jgi:exoribonuclease II
MENKDQLIADYRDKVSFNDETGTVSINGSAHIPFSKQWWFPESENKVSKQAEKDLASLIYDYKEDIEYVDDKGEVYISGKRHLPFTKQIFFVTEVPLENTNFFQKIRNTFTWKK